MIFNSLGNLNERYLYDSHYNNITGSDLEICLRRGKKENDVTEFRLRILAYICSLAYSLSYKILIRIQCDKNDSTKTLQLKSTYISLT